MTLILFMILLNRLHINNIFVTFLMNTKKTTSTLAIFAIVTAVALVTAGALATSVFALKGATMKTMSSKTPAKPTSSLTTFISCVKTTHRGLTIDDVNSCYDRAHAGSHGVGSPGASSPGASSPGASSLIPLVGLPTFSSGSGHTVHHAASHARVHSPL
jgi:hypothetical protein